MSNFTENYNKILNVLLLFSEKQNFLNQIRQPKLTDVELIAVNLTAEYMSIDSECQLFRILPKYIKQKIERSVYNRRKRRLFPHIDSFRKKLASRFNANESHFIVDSMPAEVAKMTRSRNSKICKRHYYSSPDIGYCASQKMHYYGYKIHAVCSINGIFQSFDISKASVHDIHYLKDIKTQYRHCVILGDKGYLSADYQLDLFEECKITLAVPMRKNQRNYKPQPYPLKRCRKRIETLFSQLCDQFRIRNNYAKTFDGFKTRILSKITALTLVQYINKFIFNRNINNIKVNIT